jgi:hypothetical protein
MRTVEITYRYGEPGSPARSRPIDADAARRRLDEGSQALAAVLDGLADDSGTASRIIQIDPRDHFTQLVDLAKLRWRIERDYQELKQEVSGSVTTRGVAGVASTRPQPCASGPRLSHRRAGDDSPSGPRSAAPVQVALLPDNYRPRGSALAA